jgi:hypothetical protein
LFPIFPYTIRVGNSDSVITIIGVVVILLIGFFMIPISKPKERTLNFSKNKGKPSEIGPSVPLPLNVFFNFNGHSFDAYEALGVPAGSTLEEVHLAFQRNIQSSDAGSQEFFNAAYTAVKNSKV